MQADLAPAPQPFEADVSSEPHISQSQIMLNLNSSIEDLLLKISKEKGSAIKVRRIRSFQHDSHPESPSTQTTSHVSNNDWKDMAQLPRSPKLNPHSQTHYFDRPKYQFITNAHSLRIIQDSPLKIKKMNSLFDDLSIKEVAESTIFGQPESGSCSKLDQNIKELKHSTITTSLTPQKLKLQMNLSSFQLGKEVGSGKFGDVYLCRHRPTGLLFALKKIFKSVIKEYKMQSQFALQLKILYSLDHPNIVKLYSHFQDQYHVFLLMQYIEGGELISRLGSSQKQVAQILSQMIDAVDYIHSIGVVHRDIKPQNIVVSFEKTVKLVDFGWAGIFNHKTMKTTFCGTLDYVSPEMKDKGLYSSQVDLWSLGVLTYQLLTKQAPFKQEIAHWKRKGGSRSQQWDWNIIYPPHLSCLAESFMRNLLKQNPDQRASLRYCKSHFFIRKYKESEPEDFLLALQY